MPSQLAGTVMAWTADGRAPPTSSRGGWLLVGTWGRQEMRRAILLALACAAVAVSVLAIRTTDRDRPGPARAAATPTTLSAPAQPPGDRTCRQIPVPVPPTRLALVGSRLLVASREARSVSAAEVRACRWLGTIAVLPSHAKVSPPPPQAGVIDGPDRPYALAADRHSLWVVGELTLYRYDLTGGRLTARVRLPGLAVALTPGVLWAANLAEGPTFIYGIDARTARITSKQPGDTEIVAMTAGAGAVWAVSHDRATLLRIDPGSGRVAHRIRLASEPHGVGFGSGYVWVGLYHQSRIVRVDPHTNRILGPPIGAGFATELLASAGGHLWAIPSTGGSLADPQLHTVLELDAQSGRVVGSYHPRGRPQDLVAAGNSVWVATTGPNQLVRITSSGAP